MIANLYLITIHVLRLLRKFLCTHWLFFIVKKGTDTSIIYAKR